MSVVESGAVDGIGLAENETMKMLITDHLDWQDEYIKNRINIVGLQACTTTLEISLAVPQKNWT